MNIFGDNLRRIRTSKGLKMKQLAESLNVSHQTIEKWEKGISMPKGKNLQALTEILGITANDLIYEAASQTGIVDAGDKVIVDKAVWEAKEKEIEYLRKIASLVDENSQKTEKIEQLKNDYVDVDKP